MVNRRILRVKAVKNLYAYFNCKQANFELAIENISADFARDLNSVEPRDETEMNKKASKAKEAFNHLVFKQKVEENKDQEITDSAQSAFDFYKDQNKKDVERMKKNLNKDFDTVRNGQLLALQLLKELANQNKKIVDEKTQLSKQFGQDAKSLTPLYNNQVIDTIFSNEDVKNQITRSGVSWKNDEDKLRGWYKSVLRKQDFISEYLNNENTTREDDYDVLDNIVRKLIFKNEVVETYFEERDLFWEENKPIVRSLVLKTLKSAKDDGSEVVLPPLSYNWEEDLEYYIDLFVKTIRNNEYYDALIEKRVKNWKLERLAFIDRVIIKTAICEMINFPSIPIKVTINEFIEISKTYSTPKSKNFVNGLLDALSEELIVSGEIKKSGRGLIDTK